MSRFVQISHFGGPEVLSVVDVTEPHAGPSEVRVRVQSAGLNPVDWKIFAGGPAAEAYGGSLPMGNGNDFSGTVDEVGPGVTTLSVGDEVFGGRRFFAQADYVVVAAEKLVSKPAGLGWDQAGALDIAGRTAMASVAALGIIESDTVLVSAAAGGVGVLAAQLALRTGATVIGTASKENFAYLEQLGVIAVEYGDGLAERVIALAPNGVTAVLDNNGPATIEVALNELHVPANRINTIAARNYAERGVHTVGGGQASLEDLVELAALIADGEIDLPIDSRFPLEQATEAYQRMMAGHLRGKIVLAVR